MNTEIIPPDAPEANLGAAVDFLATIAGGGRIAVTSIVPDGPLASAIFDTVTQRAELGTWLGHYNGSANLYFSLNEPTPEATGRLKERDVAVIRGVAVDIDPNATEEAKPGGFERERARLRGVAKEWADPFFSFSTPTAIIDSGGGIQMLWLLREPQPNTDECRAAVKAQARALCRYLGSDAVHSIDHLFRVPFTENLPTAKKAARGRKRAPVRLLHLSATERMSLSTLATIAAPIAEPTQPAVEMDGFDYNAVIEAAEDPKCLPAHLASALESVRQSSRGLATALANPDRSNRDFALAAIVVEAGITDPTEIGQLAFSLSPDRLVEEDGRGRGEWYASRTVREALQRTKPRPTKLDWFTGSPAPARASQRLRVIKDVVDVSALPVREWVVQPRLPLGDVTQCVGEPGVSKSTFALRDALAIATGREDLLRGVSETGQPISAERLHRSGAALLYNAEDRADEIYRRLAAAMGHYGVQPGEILHEIVVWSGVDDGPLKIMERENDRTPLKRAQAADLLEEAIKEFGVVFVVLDPQMSLCRGGRENDNDDQDAVMQELSMMANRLGINITVVHHTSKQTRDAAGDMGAGRGAFATVAKVRSAYTLTNVTGKGSGEQAWGATPADRWIRLDYSKVSHDQKPTEPIVFRRVSAPVGNGRGVPAGQPNELFAGNPRARLLADGDYAPVLEMVDVRARERTAAAGASNANSSVAAIIGQMADDLLGSADQAPFKPLWQEFSAKLREAKLAKATTYNKIRDHVTDALEAGVAVQRGEQTVRIAAVKCGEGRTAQWQIVRSTGAGAFA